MALTPEQIQAARAQYGIPAQGYGQSSSQTSASVGGVSSLHDSLNQAWGNTPTEQPKDFLTKASETVSKVFPGEKIGESLGTLGVAGGQAIGAIPGGLKGAQETLSTSPSVPELAGDYLKAGATVAGVALPLPKAATLGGAVIKGATQTGALSGALGAGESMAKGQSLKETIKNAFVSGLTGAAVGGVAGGAAKAVSSFAEKAPEHIYNNALSVSNKLKSVGKSPSKFLADEGVWGSLGSFHKASEEGIQEEGKTIATKVATKAGQEVPYEKIRNAAVQKLTKSLGGLYSPEEIGNLVDSVPVAGLKDGADMVKANAVREQLGSLIGDSKWLQSNPTQNTKAAQAVYGALADHIKAETGTAKEFARQSKWLATRKVVQNAIQKADSKYGIGMFDILSGVGGATAGGISGEGDATERLKNAALGGVAGIATERALTSPALKTGVAHVLQDIDKLPADAAGRVSREAVMQLIATLTNQGEPQESPQIAQQ